MSQPANPQPIDTWPGGGVAFASRLAAKEGVVPVSDGAFAMVPEWILESPDVSSEALRLFCWLQRHDGAGGVFPSRKRLAGLMRCSVRNVDRLVKQLVAAGAVSVDARFTAAGDRTSNEYFLSPPRDKNVATPLATSVATGGDKSVSLTRAPVNESPLNESSAIQLRFDEVLAKRLASARAAYDREGEEWPGDEAWLALPKNRRWAMS